MSTEARGSKLYVLVPLRAAMAAGIDVGPHLKACGIHLDAVGAERDAWFTREAVHELWFRLAEAVGDPVWGLHIAEAQAEDPSAFGVIEYAARNSKDLGDALERVGRYARLMHDGIDVVWNRDPAVGATLAYRIADAKHGHNRFAAEWAITSWVLRGRRYVGQDFAPTEVSFKHAAPADLREYERIFGGPVRFGAAYPGLTIAEEHLRLPVTGADSNLLRVLETHAKELVERLPEHDSVESRVRTYLATALSSGGDGSMAGVAAALGVSERVLQRELKEKGTTLREVVDDCQRQIAMAMVERTDLPDKEMSFLLGFSEPGSFTSAFRRWTQKSPLELRRKIPSYRSRDPIGLLKELQTDPISMFLNMRAEHGDIVEATVGHLQGVFLFAPEDVEHVLVTNVKNYQRKEARSYKPLKQFLGAGLVTSEGELHQKQRKLIQPAFHRRQIASFFGSMRRHAEALVESWRPRALAGEEVDVTKGIYAMTLAIIGETMLGADLEKDAEDLGHAVGVVMSSMHWTSTTILPKAERWPTQKNREVMAAKRFLDQKVEEIVRQRRASGPGSDLLGMLIEKAEHDGTLTAEHLADEVLTMFVAGHETTAVALTWGLWLISQNPDVREQLEAELEQVLGGRGIELEDVERLPYTGRVGQEILRLYPSVWALAREAAEDDSLSCYPIRAGTKVFFSPYAIHRHPRYWPEPERFDPDRFLPEKVAERPRYAYFPFSGGARKCIGDAFAELELAAVIATLHRAYRFETRAGYRPVPAPNVTIPPASGLPMRLAVASDRRSQESMR